MMSRIRPIIVGTTMACVMASAAAARTHACGSNCGRYTMRRPTYVDETIAEMPAMW